MNADKTSVLTRQRADKTSVLTRPALAASVLARPS
jgi:hypothetical protein